MNKRQQSLSPNPRRSNRGVSGNTDGLSVINQLTTRIRLCGSLNSRLRAVHVHHVFSLLLLLISPVVLLRTPVDFPAINIGHQCDLGLPAEPAMETRIVSIFERSLTTSVNNIEHIQSQSLNGVAVIKVFLQPTADINGGDLDDRQAK